MNSLGNQGDVGEVMLQVAGTQRLFLPAKCASILKLVPFTNITVSEGAQLSRSIHLGHGKTLYVLNVPVEVINLFLRCTLVLGTVNAQSMNYASMSL